MAEIPKAREVVEHRLIDKLQEIVNLKEERLEIVNEGNQFDIDRLNEISERQQELIGELKSHGVPHHPVMGSKADYEQEYFREEHNINSFSRLH